MPIFNRRGDVLAGVNAPLSINGGAVAAVPRASVCVWLTDDLILVNGQNAAGIWALSQYDPRAGSLTTINPLGANSLAAGGGWWAAQAGTTLYGNVPFSAGSRMSLTSTDGRGAASGEGWVALCTDASCTAFSIYTDGGSYWIAAAAYGLDLLGPQTAIWDGGSWGFDVRTPVPLTRQRLVRLSDGDWIVGYAAALSTIVAVPNGATDGYRLGNGFHHDAIGIGDQLHVCWCANVAETPDSVIHFVVDRTAPRVPLVVTPPEPIPPDPTPPQPQPEPPDPIPPIPIPPQPVRPYPLVRRY